MAAAIEIVVAFFISKFKESKMKLMTKKMEAIIPALHAQDGLGDCSVAYVKLFTMWSTWNWFILEYDPISRDCFGLIKGTFLELGYFNLNELESLNGLYEVERDLSFKPTMLIKIREMIKW